MSSRIININQFKIRNKLDKNTINKLIYNIISKDMYIPQGIDYNNNIMNKKLSNSILHNKCLISGRYKGHFNKFKMSRMIFKRYSEFGFLNGIRKATW